MYCTDCLNELQLGAVAEIYTSSAIWFPIIFHWKCFWIRSLMLECLYHNQMMRWRVKQQVNLVGQQVNFGQ